MRREYWRHNWKPALLVTLVLLAIVEAIIMFLYPAEDWIWELSLSGSIVVCLTLPLMVHFKGQLRENRILTQELERLVNRDRLTDLATRDRFYALIEEHSDPFGVVLMADIDHFKRVNDTYGHLVGDAVIREVATRIQEACREDDIVCRFGGEEILIFLSQAAALAASQQAERFRALIADKGILTGGMMLNVTISVGAAIKDRPDLIDSAIADADTALYVAKSLGRDRVALFWDLPSREITATG